MDKERLKLPYKDVSLEILKFAAGDIIATSGDWEEQDDDYKGPSFNGSGSWT